jgi:hypothetical protein
MRLLISRIWKSYANEASIMDVLELLFFIRKCFNKSALWGSMSSYCKISCLYKNCSFNKYAVVNIPEHEGRILGY